MAKGVKTSRYIVMSVPGHHADAEDTWWFVFDSRRHESVPDAMLPGESGRTKLALLARAMNAASVRKSRSSSGSQETGRRHRAKRPRHVDTVTYKAPSTRRKTPPLQDPYKYNPPGVPSKIQAIYDAEDRERLQRLIDQLIARDPAWRGADSNVLEGYLPENWQAESDAALIRYLAEHEITPD